MKSNPFFLRISSVFVFVIIFYCSSAQAINEVHTLHSKDGLATHNMLVFGEKTIYLSHLPMFQEKNAPLMPHRYQAILEVRFDKAGATPQEVYFKDRKSHPAIKMYTINPEKFLLPSLAGGDTVRRFKGTVFRGHPEKLQKGEGLILTDIAVTVKKVVHFREFDSAMKKPAQLEYLLFGKGDELFLAHYITSPPDFDQVLAVQITGTTFSNEELAKGIKLSVPGTANTAAARLREGQQKNVEQKQGTAAGAKKFRVQVKRELYFEEGELLFPPVFKATAEEKKAAFF